MAGSASADLAMQLHRLCGFAEYAERGGVRSEVTEADLAGQSPEVRAAVIELLAEVERQAPRAAYRKAVELAEGSR